MNTGELPLDDQEKVSYRPSLKELQALPVLANGVHLYLRGVMGTDLGKAPEYIQLRLTPALLDTLFKRSGLVHDHALDVVEAGVHVFRWDDVGTVEVNYWSLVSDALSFWLNGDTDDAGRVSSHSVDLDVLVAVLKAHGSPESGPPPAGFRWYGGALLYAASRLEGLVEAIESGIPELKARQTELEMMKAIQSETGQKTSARSKRRRPGA